MVLICESRTAIELGARAGAESAGTQQRPFFEHAKRNFAGVFWLRFRCFGGKKAQRREQDRWRRVRHSRPVHGEHERKHTKGSDTDHV